MALRSQVPTPVEQKWLLTQLCEESQVYAQLEAVLCSVRGMREGEGCGCMAAWHVFTNPALIFASVFVYFLLSLLCLSPFFTLWKMYFFLSFYLFILKIIRGEQGERVSDRNTSKACGMITSRAELRNVVSQAST